MCSFARGRVDDAELQPDGFGVNCDRRVNDGRNLFGTPEDTDKIDRLGNVLQSGIRFCAEHFPFVGINREDAITHRLQVGGNFMARAGRIRG